MSKYDDLVNAYMGIVVAEEPKPSRFSVDEYLAFKQAVNYICRSFGEYLTDSPTVAESVVTYDELFAESGDSFDKVTNGIYVDEDRIISFAVSVRVPSDGEGFSVPIQAKIVYEDNIDWGPAQPMIDMFARALKQSWPWKRVREHNPRLLPATKAESSNAHIAIAMLLPRPPIPSYQRATINDEITARLSVNRLGHRPNAAMADNPLDYDVERFYYVLRGILREQIISARAESMKAK